jgi:hypothetical protein
LFKNQASYDAFEISPFRWVHSLKGWAWLTCVRFQDQGHPRVYAVFLKDGRIVDTRYAVVTDACDAQTYALFDAMRGAARPVRARRGGASLTLCRPAHGERPVDGHQDLHGREFIETAAMAV